MALAFQASRELCPFGWRTLEGDCNREIVLPGLLGSETTSKATGHAESFGLTTPLKQTWAATLPPPTKKKGAGEGLRGEQTGAFSLTGQFR